MGQENRGECASSQLAIKFVPPSERGFQPSELTITQGPTPTSNTKENGTT